MEMLERCPGCSVTREAEPVKAESGPKAPRHCAHCGYDGPFQPAEAEPVLRPRDSLPSFAGARAKLATATQDLFRLSGNYSIPVEAAPAVSEPPAPPPPAEAPASSGRKPEQSIMFSLEALMKANAPAGCPGAAPGGAEEVSADQLWNMQAQTPLFGTAHDQALLTTPLKLEPAPSMDSMTLPSHAPNGRRWLPIVLAACGGLALAGAGIWVFTSKPAEPSAAAPAAPATLAAPPSEPVAEPEKTPAAPAEPVAAATPTEAAPTEASPPDPAPGDAVGAAGAGGAAAGGEADPGSTTPPSAAPAAAKAPAKPAKRPLARAAPSSTKAEFDKAAAKSALNAAAAQAAGCGQGGAPGKGKIQVTFATSGKVSNAQLVEGPFGGTAAGKCALRHFKAAKVPAFSGAAVTVAKSFKVD